MNAWHEDLLNLLVTPIACPESIFGSIERVAVKLGFEHVAYGFQAPYPVTQPKITLLNNYPGPWQEHYNRSGFLFTDPTVIHGRQSQAPLIWDDQAFASNPALWRDAQDHGIRAGWAQSSLENSGAGSLLTLCRRSESITASELQAKEPQMRWLVQVAHVSLSRAIMDKDAQMPAVLTPREREVLQWTADGKSAQDIADILVLSKSVVDFHLKNSIKKLDSPNKTAAVARAVLLGWLR
ncbi:MAG: autoinducer binding domain-containing protein [Limnohabitans sp.]